MNEQKEQVDYDQYAQWHRVPCEITDHLIVTGDLHPNIDKAIAQLETWVTLGVTDIIDVRAEYSDESLVKEVAPQVRYHHLPTEDAGQQQEDTWFDRGLEVYSHARANGGKILVHCYMGINRAPSLAYRFLLDEGYGTIVALELLKERRPIVGVAYADDAIDHYLRSLGRPEYERTLWVERVRRWYEENDGDDGIAMHAIRKVDGYA